MEAFFDRLLSPTSILSAAIVLGALLLWLAVRKGFAAYDGGRKNGRKRSSVAQTVYDVMKYGILLGTALTVLQINHVNVTSMVAGLGLASAIVGLALQDVLKDSIMGIHLLTDRFFEVGDVVRYGEFEGVVISFNIKTTKIQSVLDNSIMTICNRNISEIVRCSTWTDVDIPLSYEAKAGEVRAVLEEVCQEIGEIEGIEKCEFKGTQSFEDSAIVYKLRFYCPPAQRPALWRAAMGLIQDRLEEAGLKIPYQQVDIRQILQK